MGISQTADSQLLGESWSSANFYSPPNNVGYINLGFVWQGGQMRGLPNFPAEITASPLEPTTSVKQSDGPRTAFMIHRVAAPKSSSFARPCGTLGPPDQIHGLPLISGDTSGAATAINDSGQIVGISGTCDQADGRHTAKHAVLWENGKATEIGPFPAQWWNTPTAINQHGDVVGFAGDPAFVEGDILHAFKWTREDGIRPLKPLKERTPQHVDSETYGINEAGQVVGVSCDAEQTDCRAVISDHGLPHRPKRFQRQLFRRLLLARDINDKGEITGRAVDPTTGAD